MALAVPVRENRGILKVSCCRVFGITLRYGFHAGFCSLLNFRKEVAFPRPTYFKASLGSHSYRQNEFRLLYFSNFRTLI